MITRDKVVQLFTYLKDLSKLSTPHIKDVARYDQILWYDSTWPLKTDNITKIIQTYRGVDFP
jgi:hypothetical protein